MDEDKNASESLENSIDNGADSFSTAKGLYDKMQGIGSASAGVGSAATTSAGAGVASETGAAVGTAAGGPPGTVLGAVVGMATGILIKPVVRVLIIIVVFSMMVFSSLPSMLWQNPIDLADNAGPIAIYREYQEYAHSKYVEVLEAHKKSIENDFETRTKDDEFSDYDYVEYAYTLIPGETAFLSELMESSVLIIALFETHRDNWGNATLADFKQAVDSVFFWNDTILCTKESEESDITYTTNAAGEEKSTITIFTTYRLADTGIEAFRRKFHMTDEAQYLKAVEMAYNVKNFFGEADDLPMGGIFAGIGNDGTYPGGSTHSAIRTALAKLMDRYDFYGKTPIIPLAFGTWSVTSEFGPRNYAPDPIHTGLDFSAEEGTPIRVIMDGVVLLRISNPRTFGHHIVIYHGGDITTMYAHMSEFGVYGIGDSVKQGDVIGYVGNTGLSTGAHLHFEYQKNGEASNPRGILPLVRNN